MPCIYFNDTKDTGEYHKTYTEDIFKWDGDTAMVIEMICGMIGMMCVAVQPGL